MSRKRQNDDGLMNGIRRREAVLDAEIARVLALPPTEALREASVLIERMDAERARLQEQSRQLEARLAEGGQK